MPCSTKRVARVAEAHPHIGLTASVHAHVRLRLQRQAIDTLNNALSGGNENPDDPPASAAIR
ncbi:integrase [Streptomyces asiaticus]